MSSHRCRVPLRRPDSTSPAEPGGEAPLQGAAQRATLLDAELSSGDEDDEYEGSSAASEPQGSGARPVGAACYANSCGLRGLASSGFKA